MRRAFGITRRGPAVISTLGGAAVIAVASALLLFSTNAHAAIVPTVSLLTAAQYSVLAGSTVTVTTTGTTTLEQSLGLNPGTAVTGNPQVGGETNVGPADGDALQAKNDLTAAYVDAAGRTPFENLPAELGGSLLLPGVYRLGAAQLTGQLRLDAQANPLAVFIFQIDSTLTTAANSSVVFINNFSVACNVFWKVGTSATLNTGTDFIGTIMAADSITLQTGAVLEGRALTQTAAVTLDNNTITEPTCDQATSAPPASSAATSPGGGIPSSPATGPGGSPTSPATGPGGVPTSPATGPGGVPTSPAIAPGGPGPNAPATTAPGARPTSSTTRPVGIPDDGGGPPRLPTTGAGHLPALAGAGSVFVVLGGALVYFFRRRTAP